MISQIDSNTIAQYAGGTTVGLLALAYVLQKFLTGWKTDKAETSVLTLMHNELERMSEQNTTLSNELGKLQKEVISLNKELRTLTTENQRLHSEVATLTGEVSRLQRMLSKGSIHADEIKSQSTTGQHVQA